MQLGRAIKNNVQVSVENNASRDPESFQAPVMDDAFVHLCSTKDGFPVPQHSIPPPPRPGLSQELHK